jgi:ubiquinone/menaquinone biosynthesis C-methylase UbiE
VDISEVAIARARKHFPNASFSVGDIAHTSFEDGRFDVSITCFVLEHVIDPCAVIDEMIRTTRDD